MKICPNVHSEEIIIPKKIEPDSIKLIPKQELLIIEPEQQLLKVKEDKYFEKPFKPNKKSPLQKKTGSKYQVKKAQRSDNFSPLEIKPLAEELKPISYEEREKIAEIVQEIEKKSMVGGENLQKLEKYPAKKEVKEESPWLNINYVQGEELKIYEDRNNEFKDTKSFDISVACSIISVYVSAFLNTEGGKLYYGISDNAIVTGLKLSRKVRDMFTQSLDGILNKFRPPISPLYYSVKYCPVYDYNRNLIHDLYIIEIEVKKGDANKIYFTHKEEAYVKRDSSVSQLKGPGLLEFSQLKMANQ